MKHLFLGGTADGQWLDVPRDENLWQVCEPLPPAGALATDYIPPCPVAKLATYRREAFVIDRVREGTDSF